MLHMHPLSPYHSFSWGFFIVDALKILMLIMQLNAREHLSSPDAAPALPRLGAVFGLISFADDS